MTSNTAAIIATEMLCPKAGALGAQGGGRRVGHRRVLACPPVSEDRVGVA
jgi:hypothetical protein